MPKKQIATPEAVAAAVCVSLSVCGKSSFAREIIIKYPPNYALWF